jgi:hypothetical protein
MGIHVGLDIEAFCCFTVEMRIENKNNVDMRREKSGNHKSDYERLLSFCGSIWDRKIKGIYVCYLLHSYWFYAFPFVIPP